MHNENGSELGKITERTLRLASSSVTFAFWMLVGALFNDAGKVELVLNTMKGMGELLSVAIVVLGVLIVGFLISSVGLCLLRLLRFFPVLDFEAPVDNDTLKTMEEELEKESSSITSTCCDSFKNYATRMATLALYNRVFLESQNHSIALWLQRRWYTLGTSFNAAISVILAWFVGIFALGFKCKDTVAWTILTLILAAALLLHSLSCWFEMRAMFAVWIKCKKRFTNKDESEE